MRVDFYLNKDEELRTPVRAALPEVPRKSLRLTLVLI